MSRTPRSGSIAFKPRARLLKLLGEELISDDIVAVSELVKNAHDADALTVTVAFHGVTGSSGEIEVRDDGHGIDLDTLLDHWMEPAATTKVGADRLLTARGRRVLGEKGVGRFAADKLARHLEMVSRCPGSPDEVRAMIDWDLFDDERRMLDEVQNRWELRQAQRIPQQGTVLRLTGLRSLWNERMFRRLSIRLGRLLSPFREKDPFTIRIESDEFPDYSRDIRSDILDKAPYWIEADFDGQQTITLRTKRTGTIRQRWNGPGELACGPLRVRLFVFDLEGEALARIGPRMEVRAWLKEWTGVSIYRDGFRIWPYGEPHDDWLRLDQRRVNNPVEHLSNNQVIGFIDISRDGNPDLQDQTNREGLMNNPAFEALRRLVYFALQIIEAERQVVRHPVERPQATANGQANGSVDIPKELERLAERAGGRTARELRQLGQKLKAQQTRDQAQSEQLVAGYTELAAIGQLTACLSQIVPAELRELQTRLGALRHVLTSAKEPSATQPLEALAGTVDRLAEQLRLLHLGTDVNDRRRTIDLPAEICSFQEAAEPLLQRHEVRMEVTYPAKEVLRVEMRPEHLHCLLGILTANALDWLKQVKERRIRVKVSATEESCEIVFSDSGPGVPTGINARVFEPGFSTKEDGRGMGLTIAQRLVETHGGSIAVLLDRRRRGANVQIILPRKRSRATFYL